MTPKRRAINLSWFFICLCFSKSLLIKDRYIGENIRLISDIMEQTKKLNCSGILLSLDFQKAFDTLEWSCISNVLKMYNFGDCLRTWIKVLYTKVESTVLNNGFAKKIGLNHLLE